MPLRNLCFLVCLAMASLAGAAMRMEQVNDLMGALNRPRVARRAKRKRAEVVAIDEWERMHAAFCEPPGSR